MQILKVLAFIGLSFELALSASAQSTIYHIPFVKNSHGVIEVEASINGRSQKFVFDTGASLVSFSEAFFQELVADNRISTNDIVSRETLVFANGDKAEAKIINIARFSVGDLELNDVEGTVINHKDAPFLIGQSFIAKFGSVKIDYGTNEIVIENTPPKRNDLGKLKFIPCVQRSVADVETIRAQFENDVQFVIGEIEQETNVPVPQSARARLKKPITVRYFHPNSGDMAITVRNKLIQLGVRRADVAVENMSRYFRNPIPDYIEVWVY